MRTMINIITFLFLLISLLITGCGIYNNDPLESYNKFGLKCAKMGLWNEAIMRWKHIVEINPNSPQAHNNLAVAYESKGELKTAMTEYEKAMKLDQDNKIYKNNYMRFKKNYDRAMKMQETKDKIQDTKIEIQDSEIEN